MWTTDDLGDESSAVSVRMDGLSVRVSLVMRETTSKLMRFLVIRVESHKGLKDLG